MTDPRLLARQIVVAIEHSRIDVSTEAAAHAGIAAALERRGIAAEREVRLSAGDRLDLLAGGVAVEVKVKGSRRDTLRQLERYAESHRVAAIVLATGRAWPSGMVTVRGKPFFLADLSRGWL